MSGAPHQALLAGYGSAPPPTALVWSSTDQTNTTLSGGDLIATFTNLAAVRSTSTRNSSKRQVNFRAATDRVSFIGVANGSANIASYPSSDANGFALYLNDGNWYINNVQQGSTVGAVSGVGFWMALIFDWSDGSLVMYSDPDGTPVLQGTSPTSSFAGQTLYLMAGSGSGSGTRGIEINPAPSNLVGGAIGWNS